MAHLCFLSPFETQESQKEGKMESWEKHYAKLKNNKWETITGRDESIEPDEDEEYLIEEKLNAMDRDEFHQCPRCDEMNFFGNDAPYCTECGWSIEDSETEDLE